MIGGGARVSTMRRISHVQLSASERALLTLWRTLPREERAALHALIYQCAIIAIDGRVPRLIAASPRARGVLPRVPQWGARGKSR